MSKYLLSTHVVEGESRPQMSDEDMQGFMERIQALEKEMKSTGAWVFSARLHGPETATVLSSADGEVVTTDGPFAETKEHLAGFYVVEAEDLDAALALGARVTECINRPIEVRPFADFADEHKG